MNEDAFTDYEGRLLPSKYIHQELIDDENLNHDIFDCSNVDAVLASCKDLN